VLLAIAAIHDWAIDQMDVVTAFLNPEVDGDVYMAMPEGIEAGQEAPAGGPMDLQTAQVSIRTQAGPQTLV